MTQQLGSIRREPSVPALDAADLNWLIGQYISWQRTQLDNQQTVDCYACKLRWFTDWWEEEGPRQEWLLRQSDLEAFERYLRAAISSRTKRKLAWHSRNDVMRRLREMFHWACDKDYTEKDYADWVPRADGGPPKRRAAGVTALTRLLLEAGYSPLATRDRAMIAMFIGMGLRRGEVVNLNIEDVVIEADLSGYARVVGKKTRANPTGQRDAAFDAATGKIITAHLDAMHYRFGPLFRGLNNMRLSAQGVYRRVKRLIERAGLEDEIQACHDLRRAFATYYARQRRGSDSADRLRRQLGHASYGQTTEYQLLDVDDIRRDLVSPVAFVVDDLPRR
jgi:site-specific recombinase XerD